MTESQTQQRISSPDLAASLEIVTIKPGVQFSLGQLRQLLPDVETLLFFGKVYDLDFAQLSLLMSKVLNSKLVDALFNGSHSTDLQDYLVDFDADFSDEDRSLEDIDYLPVVPHGEILPAVWKSMEVTVAGSIKAVAEKLDSLVATMPGKQGNMVLQSMMKMNAKRPTLGVQQAAVHHAPQKENLLILDVSSSMGSETIRTIVDDVVALSYEANAHMAVVSDTTTHWEPGNFDSSAVLSQSEFGGTHYETLEALLNRDWGVVICVADYDSSVSSADHISRKCTGAIDTVLDVSLVNRPTYLAQVVGQLASEVKPMLIARHSLTRSSW